MNELVAMNEKTKLEIKHIESKILNSKSVYELQSEIIPQLSGIRILLDKAGLLTIEQKNEIDAAIYKAEIQIGRILKELEKGKTGPKLPDQVAGNSLYTSTIKKYKISERRAQKLQELAGIEFAEVDLIKQSANNEGTKFTKVSLVNTLSKKTIKANIIKRESKQRKIKIADMDIRTGDFKKVLDDVKNIDAIITDPPYPKEFIQCWTDLAIYAKEHLKDDGFLVAYSGQYNLDEVMRRLGEHLTYVWTFCLYHSGKKQLVNGVNIMCGWKPILVYSKGKKKMRYSAYDIVVSEDREKHSHEWQQSESGVASLIDIFSKPGDLIVDPFSGSGTFVKVAIDNGRRGIGAEIKQ